MKKRVLLSLSVVFLLAAPLLAQDDHKKTMNCSGTISEDGQAFTCDKDHHVWKVSNPAVLHDMEGHQAKLTFRRTSAPDEIFVTSASAVQQPAVTANHGDSAFRR